jgi:hypothetical protein
MSKLSTPASPDEYKCRQRWNIQDDRAVMGLIDEYFLAEKGEKARGWIEASWEKGASGLGWTHGCFGASTLDQYPRRYSHNCCTACD